MNYIGSMLEIRYDFYIPSRVLTSLGDIALDCFLFSLLNCDKSPFFETQDVLNVLL